MRPGPDDSTLPSSSPEGPATPRLLVIRGDQLSQVALVGPAVLSVGRSEAADIAIADPKLSRLHARLHLGATIELEDLESVNGTYLRGARLAPGVRAGVGPGDPIQIGSTLLLVEAPPRPQPGHAGDDGGMAQLLAVADRVAASALTVLLQGETGVGKGVLARRLHDRSPRAGGPFIELNCAAIPEALIEGELLGHERGAFTGAVQGRPGLLEAAAGGTLFLDEIGELPLAAQAKLLRMLEERQVLRLGARSPRAIDVRIIAATNQDLDHEVAAGRFRRDLLYRLEGIRLQIPPLRARRSEIAGLARDFAAEASARAHRLPPRFAPAVEAWFAVHAWPGNIRELRNIVQRAVVLCDGPQIELPHLFLGTAPPGPEPGPDPERARILEALDRFAGNQTRAAKFLGMSRTTLSARLDAYTVPRPRKSSSA